jgi:Fe-S cluster assembly protein SufD
LEAARRRLLADHAAFLHDGGRRTPDWVAELRAGALARFAERGFPTTREEAWRFTSVQAIAEVAFTRPERPAAVPFARGVESFEVCECRRHLAVFVNGHFAPSLSSVAGLPAGVKVGSLAEALRTAPELVRPHLGRVAAPDALGPFAALNTAFLADGALVYVPRGVELEEPVQLLFVSAPGAEPVLAHPRALVVVEPLAKVAVVETYATLGTGACWSNALTEVVVGDGARADCYRVQRESEQAFHTATTHLVQGKGARVSVHPVVLGGRLTRHDVLAVLAGEGGLCTLNGLYLLRGEQHADHHTTLDHARPHCESHEYFNGVLDGRSRGVFNGRIIVRPGAQRTDSKQTNNNLVLSEEARADSQPQLEIYADDVKCTHGATLGPIDEKALFYLKSRGLSAAEARSLLTYGFGAEILGRMEIAPLRAQLDRLIRARLLADARQAA